MLIVGLINNLLFTLQNINSKFGIDCKGHGFKCTIYMQFLIIEWYIDTKFCCGGGRIRIFFIGGGFCKSGCMVVSQIIFYLGFT